MKTLRFAWIDDQPVKFSQYRAVLESGPPGRRLRASIELIQVTQDFLADLPTWIETNKTKPPDLVIIDHVYTAIALPFGVKGSSVAHLLRLSLPLTPLVCLTAMYESKPRLFDQEDISEYTALFMYQHLEQSIGSLYALARDFRTLKVQGVQVREHLVDVLRPPRRVRPDLLRILPDEFQDPTHHTTEHRMARWVYNVFHQRPGFLYDRLHAATLMGLTEAGFAKVESMFARARYRGAFANDDEPRWWTSELGRILYANVPQDASDVPQLAGRELPGTSSNDHSVCYVSRKSVPPPDAVISVDATRGARQKVVRREFAGPHPNDSGTTAGFETQLILKRKPK